MRITKNTDLGEIVISHVGNGAAVGGAAGGGAGAIIGAATGACLPTVMAWKGAGYVLAGMGLWSPIVLLGQVIAGVYALAELTEYGFGIGLFGGGLAGGAVGGATGGAAGLITGTTHASTAGLSRGFYVAKGGLQSLLPRRKPKETPNVIDMDRGSDGSYRRK